MTIADIRKQATDKMAKSVETLRVNLTHIRTGRAHVGLLDAIKVDYDVTRAAMTDDGSLPDDVLRDEVASRSELTKVAKPPSIGAVFDYTITRKNYAQLKAAGWQPAR